MFTKKKFVGSARRTTTVRAYRKVIDWEAVGGAIVLGFIGFIVLAAIF